AFRRSWRSLVPRRTCGAGTFNLCASWFGRRDSFYASEAFALIISRSDTTGADKNFKCIASNGGPPRNWSTLSGLGFTIAGGSQGEIKVGIVQATTNGWTQGDLYFGSGQPGKIGKISADGSTVVNANWATLTNSTQMVGETNVFGGLYIDQTGVFGG